MMRETAQDDFIRGDAFLRLATRLPIDSDFRYLVEEAILAEMDDVYPPTGHGYPRKDLR